MRAVGPYQAVVTTGIYCRPGCGARPLAANVRSFPLAAAAEAAGFRACLRCRPYRWEPPPTSEPPELVKRALRLVLEGALDAGTEARLAARVGVSERHLRRLFDRHLGVSPGQLARSRRAHFARRLLDDTDLGVTEVAFASGFGSVRQMNRAFLEIFQSTPTRLRARRRAADRLAADGGLPIRPPVPGPLAWEQMLGYLGRRAIPGVERVDGDRYVRTVCIEGEPGVIQLSRASPDTVLLRAHLPHWDGIIDIVSRARRIFNLDGDIAAATVRLASDPRLGPLVESWPGLRPPGAWDGFEVGVRAIVGQQVSVPGATTLIGRIVERYGVPLPGLLAMGLTHLFPEPQELAGADLAGLGMPGSRAAAIQHFAAAVAEHRLHLERSGPLEELVAELVALPGLGLWTANYLALRLGEPDAFPASDLGLRRALANQGGLPSPAQMIELAAPWQPFRAYAALHLWLGQPAAGT
jgi:AraC family transcriptional regulator of adaptative response / DNA-3-methyladenine glycosylase II